jgi:DNA-binding beta-propeller fold protein YncE
MCSPRKLLAVLACYLLTFATTIAQKKVTTWQVPGANEYSKIDPEGYSVLCSGRYVTPAGKMARITRAPFGLKLTPDGKKALILHHTGVITLVDLTADFKTVAGKGGEGTGITRIPSYDGKIPSALNEATFIGVAFSKDSQTAYLSGGDRGNVVIFDMNTLRKTGEISLDGTVGEQTFVDSFTTDLTIDHDKNELLVLDRGNFRLVRIDLATRRITASVKVGRIPFGIALSPDKKLCFVANVGLFEYPAVPGLTEKNKDTMMLHFPPYGIPSKEAEEGVTLPDGRRIPGLGSMLADEAMSVWTVDLATNKVMSKQKTGYQIGEMLEESEIVGGSHPNSLAVGSQFAYVTNASNDNLSVIDYKKHKVVGEIQLKIDKRIDQYRGIMPFGLCLSKDESTLYVACLGLNAVAVVDAKTRKTKGFIPAGWGTTRVVLSNDEQYLYITSARGLGAGANGGNGFVKPPQGTYIGDIQLGTFQRVAVPNEKQLAAYTQQVLNNTFREVAVTDDGKNPLPALPKLRKSPIKHIVYITKENRTYDEIFGQLKTGKGDSTLARFGVNVTYTLPDSLKSRFPGLAVMPNHHKVARQFAFSDNFYCDSDASIHGHHWMVGTIPNEYVEANSATESSYKVHSTAPGRRFPKTTGSQDPEDYNEKGCLWENMGRNKISFYNFGEANEFANVREEWNDTIFGAAFPVVAPMQKILFDNTSRNYAGFNMNIPDQFRMQQFESEFTRLWLSGKDTMPSLITMQVPNDHGADIRPKDGYPYPHSFMADNDLAVGRILHFLSRTKYWKNTLVIITEDDPQGGLDHIDAHRSVLMMAGPYVKKGYVSHTHANFGSLLKVVYNILGAGYVNQYDATASLLQDFFTDKPDFTPYAVEMVDKRIFDPQKAMDKYNKTFDWRKIQQGPEMDDEDDQRREHYRQNPK